MITTHPSPSFSQQITHIGPLATNTQCNWELGLFISTKVRPNSLIAAISAADNKRSDFRQLLDCDVIKSHRKSASQREEKMSHSIV